MAFDNTKPYNPIALGEIDDTTEEWLRWREHGPHWRNPMHPEYVPVAIGGSAVSIIFGCNKWTSKLELFHKKSKIAQAKTEKEKDEGSLQRGHALEPYIANAFVEYMNLKGITDVEVVNDINMFQHPYYKFALANLDRRIKVNGIPGILEIKKSESIEDINTYWKQDKVPPYYEWQCRYYMEVMNVDYVYLTCMWGFTLDDMAVLLIRRDKELGTYMMEKVAEFVEQCELGIEPPMQEGEYKTLIEYYLRLYGEIQNNNAPIDLVASPELDSLMQRVMTLSEKKSAAEKYKKEVELEEAEITAKLLALTEGKGDFLNYRMDENTIFSVKLKVTMKKDVFDTEKFKADHPDIFDAYKKPAEIDVTALKKKDKDLAKKYLHSPGISSVSIAKTMFRDIPLTA